MAEVYPSDNELLNVEVDSETGVEFIATGQSPYYLQFRKLLSRLLLATKRANDLRVYDDGGLDIGVKAGSFWRCNELVEFTESQGNAMADDKENIYVYLDSAGELVCNEYDGFPDMADEAHVRLAIVATSNGDIDSIVDCRGGYGFVVPAFAGGVKKIIEAHTEDDSLTACESGSVHTNRRSTGAVKLTLPSDADEGVTFTFAVQAVKSFRIDPGVAAIFDSSGETSGKYKAAGAIGDCMTVVADADGNWAVTSKFGNWYEEA